jgi:hypothetical protein
MKKLLGCYIVWVREKRVRVGTLQKLYDPEIREIFYQYDFYPNYREVVEPYYKGTWNKFQGVDLEKGYSQKRYLLPYFIRNRAPTTGGYNAYVIQKMLGMFVYDAMGCMIRYKGVRPDDWEVEPDEDAYMLEWHINGGSEANPSWLKPKEDE